MRALDKLRKWQFFAVDHLLVCLMVLLLIVFFSYVSVSLSLFNPIERAFEDFEMTDVYYEILRSDDKELCTDIVLVDVTSETSRSELAQTISDINSCRPKLLLVDIIFERPGVDNLADAALVSALEEGVDHEILSCKLVDYDPESDAFRGVVTSFFSEFDHFQWAYSNVPSGVVRSFTMNQRHLSDTVSSLSYAAACAYRGVAPESADFSQQPIIYSNTDFPVVDGREVLQNRQLLEGKIVMMGTLAEEADMHITPIGKMAGMKILAYSTLSHLSHRYIRQMGHKASLLLAFVLCYLSAFIGWRIIVWSPGLFTYWLKIYYFVVMALLVWLSFICFVRFDYNVALFYPLLATALVEMGREQYMWIVRGLQKWLKWKIIRKSIYAVEE